MMSFDNEDILNNNSEKKSILFFNLSKIVHVQQQVIAINCIGTTFGINYSVVG